MHQEKRCGRVLAVILPAAGIMALTGCVQQLCANWMTGLSMGYIQPEKTVSYESDSYAAEEIRTTASEDMDAVVTFASNDFSENTGVMPLAASARATVRGCGLYIDGQFYGAYSSASNLRMVLESLKAAYATGDKDEMVTFTRDIQLVDGTYPASDLLTYSGIKSVLESTIVTEKEYTVSSGDTWETVAQSYDMELSRFESLNKELSEKSPKAGETVTLNVEEPLIQIAVRKKVTETVSIPYETEVVEGVSSSGRAQVITEGKNGSKTVTANVVMINGKEAEREVLSEEILVEPVTRQVTAGELTGTSYSASYYGDTGSGILDEGMIWPLPNNGGTETCYFGEDGHQGVDLAISAGTDIYAAASGKVVVAGVYYTYGNCVVIDHGNGVRTLYAHCSSLNVSVGDEVSQGDVIGYVGMTGYATGNHLHFEVHINNRSYDPYNYIAR